MSDTDKEALPDISVRFTLKISGTYELSGDYMRNADLAEFLKWANDETRFLTVLIQRGQTEPKRIPAKIEVEHVHLSPR